MEEKRAEHHPPKHQTEHTLKHPLGLTEQPPEEHHPEKTSHRPVEHHPLEEKFFSSWHYGLLALAIIVLIFNQVQISSVSTLLGGSSTGALVSNKELSTLDLAAIKSTGHTVAAVFPVENFKTADDAMAAMFPSGTPDYGQALGVSFDDPVGSLSKLASMYRGLKTEVEQKNPEAWQRFINLASNPVGISCEFCCGIGPIGADKNGNSRCGCQHNPALLSVALYLTAYTDYSDGEILREVMRWKTLFFPKNMIELGVSLAGGDTSKLKLPGMVGGC
ncbi:hypothetical protein HYX14_02450 [Candidatus Woesearchaeota archaeon]|nr:hypothetical protein [Candidatus Woesearchaeota archaeon]